ncbi:hypothetical protein CCH79_00001888, partial [Gambusia affinis]
SIVPTWAVFWLCLPIRAIRTGLSPRIIFLLAGTHILPTGTVHHAGRGEMDAYPTLAAFTLSTGAAKVSHTLHLSAVSPSYYRFHVEHLQSDDYSKDKDAPALIGEMDSSGSLNAHALLHLTERVRARTVFQTQQSQFVTWQFETEYRGSDFTAAVTVANPDILRESVILVAHFLQSVSSGLVLGGELVYHRGRAEEGGILTLAGQYSGPNWVATLNAGKGGAHASYYHRANKQIQVGVEFEASTRTQETTASFGYQMDLPEANMVFRGMINSRCIIGGVLEKRLTPLPATLIMGAFVNHRGDKLQVGLGV